MLAPSARDSALFSFFSELALDPALQARSVAPKVDSVFCILAKSRSRVRTRILRHRRGPRQRSSPALYACSTDSRDALSALDTRKESRCCCISFERATPTVTPACPRSSGLLLVPHPFTRRLISRSSVGHTACPASRTAQVGCCAVVVADSHGR